MPIDMQAMSKDPDFQKLSPAEQQEIMATAQQRNQAEKAATVPQTPEEWDARTQQMQQELTTGVEGVEGLMLGGNLMQGAYQLGTRAAQAVAPTLGRVAGAIPATMEAGASYLSRKLNVARGTEQPGMLGDFASVALPPVVRGASTVLPAIVRASPAGRALTTAEEQTAAAGAATEAKNLRGQQVYEARTAHATEQAAAKNVAQEAKYQRGVQEARTRAGEQTIAEQQAYQTQVQGYETAVGAHRTAKAELQAIPGQFGPETPSRTLYAAAAKANPQVELRQTAAMAEELMGTPEGLQTIQRGGVQPLAEELHDLAQQSLSRDGLSYARLQKIREDLGAEVGRLRRQGGTEYRDVARLYGALERDLGGSEASVLQAASKARRQEYAVEELHAMVQTGAPGIKRLSSGAYQVDPGQLMTRAEKALSDTEKMFGGSFTAEERARILQQFERHQGLAPIPRRPGDPPVPVTPRDVPVPEPVTPRSVMRPVPVEAPPPVDPRTLLEPPSLGGVLSRALVGGGVGLATGGPMTGLAVTAATTGIDVGTYALSKMMLAPDMQPMLRSMMDASGTISAENMARLMQVARLRGMIGTSSSERR